MRNLNWNKLSQAPKVWPLALLSCLVSLTAPANAAAAHEKRFSCDTKDIGLLGKLAGQVFYGPPGFGETPAKDTREKQLLLVLEDPITVVPLSGINPGQSSCLENHAHITKIQLFIYPANKREAARRLVGKQIIMGGTLGEGNAPSEHTKIVMAVSSLSPN